MTMRVPVGYRFEPSNEELIEKFLLRRVVGHEPVPWNPHLVERDLYSADPWIVLPEDDPCWTSSSSSDKLTDCHHEDTNITIKNGMMVRRVKKVAYAFTMLKRKSEAGGGSRFDRIAGNGTWKGKAVSRDISYFDDATDNLKTIGNVTAFTFKKDDRKKIRKGFDGRQQQQKEDEKWIMHEYSLTEDSLRFCLEHGIEKKKAEEMVLCAVYRSYKENIRIYQHHNHRVANRNRPARAIAHNNHGDIDDGKKRSRRDAMMRMSNDQECHSAAEEEESCTNEAQMKKRKHDLNGTELDQLVAATPPPPKDGDDIDQIVPIGEYHVGGTTLSHEAMMINLDALEFGLDNLEDRLFGASNSFADQSAEPTPLHQPPINNNDIGTLATSLTESEGFSDDGPFHCLEVPQDTISDEWFGSFNFNGHEDYSLDQDLAAYLEDDQLQQEP